MIVNSNFKNRGYASTDSSRIAAVSSTVHVLTLLTEVDRVFISNDGVVSILKADASYKSLRGISVPGTSYFTTKMVAKRICGVDNMTSGNTPHIEEAWLAVRALCRSLSIPIVEGSLVETAIHNAEVHQNTLKVEAKGNLSHIVKEELERPLNNILRAEKIYDEKVAAMATKAPS